MKQNITRFFTKVLTVVALSVFLPGVNSWAAEGDTHDFSQTLQQLLNNNASISSINIAQQSYPVKKVIVSYRYNKTITNAVTVEVSVDGSSWGTAYTEGTDKSYSTMEFSGESATGSIVISFTNNTGSGTGHGTFYVNNVQLVEGASSSETCATPTFTPAEGTYYEKQNVTLSCATSGASIYYTTNGDDPTSSSTQYTSAISVSSTTTLKAIAVKEGLDNSDVASATYTIKEPVSGYSINFETNDLAAYTDWTFTNIGIHEVSEDVPAHNTGTYYGSNVNANGNGAGTAYIQTEEKVANPGTFTCYVSKESGNTTSSTWYVQVSSDGSEWTDVESQSATSMTKGAWTGFTADLSSYTNVFVRLYYSGSTAIRAVDDISLTTVEPSTDPSITLSSYDINADADENIGTIEVTYNNIKEVVAEVKFCDSDGKDETYDWITAEINDNNNVYYVISANEGEERTAYFKVYALDDEANDVYSNLVTITQAAYVPDYATLPFAFDGGISDIENKSGLTQSGLGSDYKAKPYLKFDSTDDYVILKINEAPGTLSFDIQGNGFSGGTFTVQTSIDGETYTDLAAYTELGDTQSEEFDNLDNDVRYIKWIYTEKSAGNVGLGNISLSKFAPSEQIITAVENGGRYWVTFYYEHANYALSDGAKAYTVNSDNQLYLLGTTGSVIPEDTAVIIIADTDSITLTKTDSTFEVANNILQGSNTAVAKSSITIGTPYVLGIVGEVLGFYEYTGDNIPAYRAYYVK